MNIKWAYLRNGWTSCKKAREYLENDNIQIAKEINARKDYINENEASEIIKSLYEIITSKGKNVNHWDPKKDKINDILKAAIGNTGNLRAPALLIGKKLIIGFNEDLYKDQFS